MTTTHCGTSRHARKRRHRRGRAAPGDLAERLYRLWIGSQEGRWEQELDAAYRSAASVRGGDEAKQLLHAVAHRAWGLSGEFFGDMVAVLLQRGVRVQFAAKTVRTLGPGARSPKGAVRIGEAMMQSSRRPQSPDGMGRLGPPKRRREG